VGELYKAGLLTYSFAPYFHLPRSIDPVVFEIGSLITVAGAVLDLNIYFHQIPILISEKSENLIKIFIK
tara:strand:- start:160 stop:366 length:207 start_codon:yes stop_codon:yes gene_type:complete